MHSSLKAAALAFAMGTASQSAYAIDPFFPEFGNNGIDVLHYDLDLDVAPAKNKLDAKAALTIVALRNLKSFTLDLAGLKVTDVSIDGEAADFSRANDKLKIKPASTIAKGAKFKLTVSYGGKPEPIQDPTAPNDPLFLGWFKYKNATYVVSEPVGASSYFPANDEPTDKASFTTTLKVPPSYTGVANGNLKSTKRAVDGNTFVWNMKQPMTTWLATAHVNKFKLDLDETSDGIPVRVYYTDATPKADVKNYALPKKIIPFMENLVGPYPFAAYGSVVVDDPILYYALETQTMSTFPLGFATEEVVAHELAHQWFGDSVSVAKWADLWLAEGSATYFELLWPNRDDANGFDDAMRDLYDYAKENELGPAVVEGPEQIFSDRTYVRGALALYALQLEVGEKTFFKILQKFLKDFKGGNATSQDFIDTAVAVSDDDDAVTELLNAWLFEEPLPDLPEVKARARGGPVATPDIVGLRCGRGSHRGSAASC